MELVFIYILAHEDKETITPRAMIVQSTALVVSVDCFRHSNGKGIIGK